MPMNYGYQPLFEDRRPRNIGDTLTIVLQENVSASKSSSANASRDGSATLGLTAVPRALEGLLGGDKTSLSGEGKTISPVRAAPPPITPSPVRLRLPSIRCCRTAT